MREVADRQSHNRPALAGGHRRGALLRNSFAAAVSGALVATAALAGPADASPAHTRYTFTLNDKKGPSSPPAAGPTNRVIAYVANIGSDTVTPIATATNTASTSITVGHDPRVIAVTPNGKTAYVVNSGNSTVTPIVTATNTAGSPITVSTFGSESYAIAITPNGKTAYVVNVNARGQ